MRVELFDFDLPSDRIAMTPAQPRDSAKMLHVGAQLADTIVADLPALLNPGDVLVFNNSRVIPARLFADIGGREIEVLLHQPVRESTLQQQVTSPFRGEVGRRPGGGKSCEEKTPSRRCASTSPLKGEVCVWQAFAKPAKKLKEGMELHFAADFSATVLGRSDDGQVLIEFPYPAASLFDKLRQYGHMPLPPYIARADDASDQQHYQTIYAAADGSVAAPTAGLHFTQRLMDALRARGVAHAFVTLHVGAGTFQPVKVEDTDEHIMHREPIEIGREACDIINAARAAGGKVVAVGTTSLRILESVAAADGMLAPFVGDTGIFITPGYRFKIVDRLMTNFHLPKSSLFMLVSAFAGLEKMHAAYAYAMANGYRFYSYGDTSLLEKQA